VGAEGCYEVEGVESFGEDVVERDEGVGIVADEEVVYESEGVFVVKDVEVAHHVFVVDVGAAECYGLVEDGEGVAHGPVGFHRYDVEGLVVDGDALLGGDTAEVADYIGDADAVEIICLAAGEDGREDFVLLRGGEDEDCVCRWFFKRL